MCLYLYRLNWRGTWVVLQHKRFNTFPHPIARGGPSHGPAEVEHVLAAACLEPGLQALDAVNYHVVCSFSKVDCSVAPQQKVVRLLRPLSSDALRWPHIHRHEPRLVSAFPHSRARRRHPFWSWTREIRQDALLFSCCLSECTTVPEAE